MKYSIQYQDLGIDYRDVPPWRNYELNAEGDTLDEILGDIEISENDQDGGVLNSYDLDDAPTDVQVAALRMIERTIIEAAIKPILFEKKQSGAW